MKAKYQIEPVIDRLNVTLDQINAEREEAKTHASTTQYQSYAQFYERVKSAQDQLRLAVRDFERAQARVLSL